MTDEAKWAVVDAHECTACGHLDRDGYRMVDHLKTHTSGDVGDLEDWRYWRAMFRAAADRGDATARILDDHRAAVDDATTRLERIAEAHGKEVDEHGGVSGFCGECDHVWPCPTYRWATAPTVDGNCTWDLADCTFDHDHEVSS